MKRQLGWASAAVMLLTAVHGASAAPASLADAVKAADRAAARAAIKAGANVNEPLADGSTVLHWAVNLNDVEMVDALLAAKADVKLANRFGVTPIWLAVENGSTTIIERLLKAGADPNTTVGSGESLLMTASITGVTSAVEALLRAGASPKVADSRGQTPLMWAAANNNVGVITALLAAGADLRAKTSRPGAKQPPASRVQKANGQPIAVSESFGGGRSFFQDAAPTGFSAYLFAVRAGRIEAAKALLEAGADVNETLSDGESALVVACANGHWQLADYLLDRGADPNLDGAGWNALHQIVRTRRPHIGFATPGPIPTGTLDSINVIKKMIAKGVRINTRMFTNGMKDGQRNALIRTGATAFFLAAKNTDTEVMRVLLASGADAKMPNVEDTTPLMVAAGIHIWNPGEDGGSLAGQEDEVLEAVKLCVDNGNDVNAVDILGWTALHGAAFRGAENVVAYLISKGANLEARNKEGWTPLAISNGLSYSDFFKQQPHISALLKKEMQARGLSIDGHAVDPKVCMDCLQTQAAAQNAFLDRERKAEELGFQIRAAQQLEHQHQ